MLGDLAFSRGNTSQDRELYSVCWTLPHSPSHYNRSMGLLAAPMPRHIFSQPNSMHLVAYPP